MQEKTNNLSTFRTFRTLFLVYGILLILGSIFCLFYAAFGLFFLTAEAPELNDPEMFNPGSIFLVVGLIAFVVVALFGVLALLSSKYIKQRKKHQFVFVTSILMCLTGLLGILLGVFALIELSKADVKELFGKQ